MSKDQRKGLQRFQRLTVKIITKSYTLGKMSYTHTNCLVTSGQKTREMCKMSIDTNLSVFSHIFSHGVYPVIINY